MASAHDLLVLSLVGDQPAHGYDLRRSLDRGHLAHCTSMSTPQIYSVLRRLKGQGLVSAKRETKTNAPPRTVYSITNEGKAALARMLGDEGMASQRVLFQFDAVLSAMGYIEGLRTAQSLDVLEARIRAVEAQLEVCRKAWESDCSKDPAPGLVRSIFDHRKAYLEGESRWLQDLAKEVQVKGWASFASSKKGRS